MSKHTSHGTKEQQEEKTAQAAAAAAEVRTGGPETEPADAGRDQVKSEESADAAAELGAKVASLEAEISNLKDQYLRKAAEFENFRKRMNKEKQDAIDFANQSLLLDLITVIDDFERAIKSSEAGRDYDTLHEGISLIEKRLVSQLENKWGLVRFESAGQAFDPNRHEAVMMEKTAEVTEPMVSEDFLKGYSLKERIVRSAKVKVLMPLETAEGPSA